MHCVEAMASPPNWEKHSTKSSHTKVAPQNSRPSIRLKVPGTGATSFHFSYKTVTKSESKRHGSKAANTGTTRGNKTKAHGKAGEKTMTNTAIAAIKHQAYVERMEEAPSQANDLTPIGQLQNIDQSGPSLDLDNRENVEPSEKDPSLSTDRTNEIAPPLSPDLAQIFATVGLDVTDDADQLNDGNNKKSRAQIFGNTTSFGNIAPNYQERLEFWQNYSDQNPDRENDFNASSLPLGLGKTEAEQLAPIVNHAAELADQDIPFWITIREPANAPGAEKRAYILTAPAPLATKENDKGEIQWDLGAKKPGRQHRAKNPERNRKPRP
jgi:hypothetical protein